MGSSVIHLFGATEMNWGIFLLIGRILVDIALVLIVIILIIIVYVILNDARHSKYVKR